MKNISDKIEVVYIGSENPKEKKNLVKEDNNLRSLIISWFNIIGI